MSDWVLEAVAVVVSLIPRFSVSDWVLEAVAVI